MSFPSPPQPTSTLDQAARGFVLGPDEGDASWWLGSLSLTKVTRTHTGGALDIVDHRVPAGYAPPRHVHTDQDEVFLIIDGTFAVTCGGDHWTASPGSLVFLPRLVPHGFTVSDAGPGRTLLFNAPAGFADVIAELGTPATSLELPGPDVPMPDPDRIAAVSTAHGIHPA